MIGKKNIVFGFIYLALTAFLGAVMILGYFDERRAAESAGKEKLGILQQIAADNYEVNLEPVKPLDLAKANTEAILALSAQNNAQKPINRIKSGPHTHGTAAGLLNIAVGFLLMFLAVPAWFKQLISWLFIAGALLWSGMLYLLFGLGQSWAAVLLNGPPGAIGPGLTLLGLVLAGIAAAIGLRSAPVQD
ncbi:MAG TPA: hypothetical protein VJB18_08810 [Burkholderiales bacterium]|nr:hypothetical protein [Burkholderiales bacterium]